MPLRMLYVIIIFQIDTYLFSNDLYLLDANCSHMESYFIVFYKADGEQVQLTHISYKKERKNIFLIF